MRKFFYIWVLLLLIGVEDVWADKRPERQSRESYIERYAEIAVRHMERYGIPASITLAQGILESDCGNSYLSRTSNNHFGIKCKTGWKGEKVYHDDDAKGECFRAYPSVEESYEDHARFLDSQPRYDSLFSYSPTDYRSWARGLKAAGYATAPDYAERLVRIIEESRLYLFDREQGERLYNESRGKKSRFEEQSSVEELVTLATDGMVPDAMPESISMHRGYALYRNNGVACLQADSRDSYEHIGEQFEISARNLRKFNEVGPEAQPLSGEVVYIERKGRAWTGEATHHIAVEGETLFSVAQRYGIRQKSLRKMNHMKRNEEHFETGTKIRIR